MYCYDTVHETFEPQKCDCLENSFVEGSFESCFTCTKVPMC